MRHAFAIPFRDRGTDPLRAENLACVREYLESLDLGPVFVVSDGRSGSEQFNRHAAYNSLWDWSAEIITYHESDMLVPRMQLERAIILAHKAPGLVVPFRDYHALDARGSTVMRGTAWIWSSWKWDYIAGGTVMRGGTSIGAVNTLSRETLAAVGQWDEGFEGSWYDDRAMCIAFGICCGATRYVSGSAYHLYHLPGWKGEHLSDEDRAATAHNRERLKLYQLASTPEQIRELTRGTT